MARIRKVSRTVEILNLYDGGKTKAEISRLLGISAPGVWVTVRRHRNDWSGYMPPITGKAASFLRKEATERGVSVAQMARAFLNDALSEAMGE